jgi:hypothetical protein
MGLGFTFMNLLMMKWRFLANLRGHYVRMKRSFLPKITKLLHKKEGILFLLPEPMEENEALIAKAQAGDPDARPSL